MSKSMWIDAVEQKPVKLPKSNAISVDAFFWVRGRQLPDIGYYDYALDLWSNLKNHGTYDPLTVEYFAYVDNPYK